SRTMRQTSPSNGTPWCASSASSSSRSRACRPLMMPSDVSARIETLDYRQHLFGSVSIDQIDGAFVVQEGMARVQPETGLIGRVEIGKAVHDVPQVRDDGLCTEVGRSVPPQPA